MIIALAGHVDHGKTALIRALTGIDADRLPEEKKRGMTIDLGFAHTRLPAGEMVGFVDVPGHERFMTNMLAGVLSIDTVLVVIAADDGPMPQTREHLSILHLTGVRDIACVISKIDRVDDPRRAAVRLEVAETLNCFGYGAARVMEASAITGAGIETVRDHIETVCAARGDRGTQSGFRLAIDRSFSLAGTGLVVTGTAASGRVSIGDRLLLSPSRLAARVRGIQIHGAPADSAAAGDRCALAITGPRVERARLKRGDWLIDPELHAPVQRIDVWLRAAEDRAPRHAGRAHVHLGAGSQPGRVLLLEARDMAPGQAGFATLALDKSVSCLYGDRLVLRDESTGRVIAGGHVIDPFPPERRVRRERRAASLLACRNPDHAAAFQALLAAEGWADRGRFARGRNLPADFAWGDDGDAIRVGPVLIAPATVDRARDDLTAYLQRWHVRHPDRLGPGKAGLLRGMGALPEAIANAILALSRARGEVVQDGLGWRLPDHRPVLSPSDEAAWTRIRQALDDASLRPPRLRELADTLGFAAEETEALLVRLERFGRLARVARNRWFLPETISALTGIAAALAAESEEAGFTAAEFNKRSGIGRNLTIEVLEYLDSIGVTRRTGDLRHVETSG